MKTLLTLLLSISLSNIAYANGVYITQAGIPVPEITTRDEDASNIITIYQSE